MKVHEYNIKTHSSVLCGKKPAHDTMSILTGNLESFQEAVGLGALHTFSTCAIKPKKIKIKKHDFCTSIALYFHHETRQVLLWTHSPTSVLHIPNLSEIVRNASCVPEICDFKNIFFLFHTLTKTTIKCECHNCYLEICHTAGEYNSASWYQGWLEYDKQAKSC